MTEDDPDATIVRRPAPAPPPAQPRPPAVAPPQPPPAALAQLQPPAPRGPSALDQLRHNPELFDLDQAAFVIAQEGGQRRDAIDLPYAAVPRLGLPHAEVTEADPASGGLTTPLFGLIGPSGTLPRHYTATTGAEMRQRNQALRHMLEMLARRLTGMWVRAGAKYRPTRDAQPTERALDAVIGMGTPGLAERMAVPAPSLRYHAGHLAARSRSASRLAAMIGEETGFAVEIIEFSGGWLRLPPSEQTRMGSQYAQLGVDAAAGAQVWDPQARFIMRLGPLDAKSFERLLPGRPLFERICGLTRLFVGPEQDFALNPVLSPDAVPATKLGPGEGRLGLTTWMAMPKPRTAPAREAMLRPPAL